jgi:hypothetical protein
MDNHSCTIDHAAGQGSPMKAIAFSSSFFGLALFASLAHTAQPGPSLLPSIVENQVGAKEQPAKEKEKKAPEKKLAEPPAADLFAPTVAPGSGMQTYFNPNMMGDWHTIYARQNLAVLGVQTTTTTTTRGNKNGLPPGPAVTTTTATPVLQNRTVLVAVPSRGAFKIAENASPLPQDRVFFTYNNFQNLGFPEAGSNGPQANTSTSQVFLRNQATTTTVTTVSPAIPRVNLDREVFGFEKTFLGGDASIELRAPLLQQGSGAGGGYNGFGDLTIIGKYALYFDRTTGNVFSTGLGVTVPTGQSIPTTDGSIRDVLLQPFVGYIWNFDRFFVQGFHSLVVPTDSRDVTMAFNDLGINFWLYRNPDRFLSFVVPTLEAHVTTPLNHRDLNGPIVIPDMVVLTTGIHFGLGRNSSLTVGAATPVTGPRPYTVESFLQFNWRF